MNDTDTLQIDGSKGEGGGQIVRSSLALSAATGRPVEIVNIRARRRKPGLMRQHLTSAQAAAAICQARTEGLALGSDRILFEPGPVSPGEYSFAVGTAGSTSLVLQTVLPPLMTASLPSVVTLSGGTHNPMAPPFDFLQASFAPQLERMGGGLKLDLVRPGFYPAGGGEVVAEITPVVTPRALELLQRGSERDGRCRIFSAHLPTHVAEREWEIVQKKLAWTSERLELHRSRESHGPGNALSLFLCHGDVTSVFTGFGSRGVSARAVAQQALKPARVFQQSDAAVEEHLADQLLLPMALLAGGSFTTLRPSLHTTTNAEVLGRFLGEVVSIEEGPQEPGSSRPPHWRVTVQGRLPAA